ncbi:MAG: glycosyltransferase family 39 protein [Clostridia bacterium]|nr:glycosyltransferase family 39 protein [Clostridia bacterium]
MTRSMRITREILYWLVIAALLTAGGFLLFTNLGEAAISDCDEARHGINAYEMWASGDYVVSTFQGEPDYWNLKPPLTYWCIMLSYQLFGFSAFGMRFYSALSMLLTMAVMAVWMKKRYGSLASIFCQLFWIACAMVYGPHFARFGDADAQMLLFYVIAMLCMLESPKNLKWLYGSAVCFGLAFMSKSWHAALIPVTCFVFVCVTGMIRKLRLKHYLLLIFFGLLPIMPWAVARYMRDGMKFFELSLTVDVGARATTVHEWHYGGPLYYVEYLFSDPACVLAMAMCAAALLWKGCLRSRLTTDETGIALWFLVPLVLYSVCVSKLAWYIFVSLPALAIGGGMLIKKLARRGKLFIPRSTLAAVLCALLVFWGVGNWEMVSNVRNEDSYQVLLGDYFDRDFDSGTKVYIQYESENDYSEIDYRAWVQDDMLYAMLCGDLDCQYGGSEAFMEEEDHAYLLCHDIGINSTLFEEFPIVTEEGRVTLFENLN